MALGTEPGLQVSGCWLWVWFLGVTGGVWVGWVSGKLDYHCSIISFLFYFFRKKKVLLKLPRISLYKSWKGSRGHLASILIPQMKKTETQRG